MKQKLLPSLLMLSCFLLLTSCFSARESKPKASNSQQLNIQKEGIMIDAKYDHRLDNLIPGYKIMTVGLTNNGVDTLRLNPLQDRWEIVDAYGKNRRAINSLRIKDPATWSRLPDKVRQLIEYPIGISVGYSETIDLFFPDKIDLNTFRSISFYNAQRKQNFDALANLDLEDQKPINPPVEATKAAPKKKTVR